MSIKKNSNYNLLGIDLDLITKKQAIEKIDGFFNKKIPSLITTTNLEFIILSKRDDDFKNIINKKSAINSIDGSGIVWAIGFLSSFAPKTIIIREIYIFITWMLSIIFMPISLKVFKKYLPEKISGSDFVWDLSRYAAKNNKQIFLLGYSKGVDPDSAGKASLKLLTDVYDLKIAGTHSGTDSVAEENKITSIIKKSGADILMVGLGSPRQEKWLDRNLKKTGCKVGIGLGGTFDFIAGIQKRSPKWIQKIGFEWLYRLFQNPRRIKRQINTIPLFLYLVLKEKYRQK